MGDFTEAMKGLDAIQDEGGEWDIEAVEWDQREIYGRYRISIRFGVVAQGSWWGDDLVKAIEQAITMYRHEMVCNKRAKAARAMQEVQHG